MLTTLIKCFFREMPEPAITFDLYENFLNASGMPSRLFLPLSHFRSGGHGGEDPLSVDHDRPPPEVQPGPPRPAHVPPGPSGPPGIRQQNGGLQPRSHLRPLHPPPARHRPRPGLWFALYPLSRRVQEQLADVSRQAVCVQTLIEEKLRQYKATLNNIVELENASHKVSVNLQRIEEHQQKEEKPPNMGTAKMLFEEQLDFLGKEKYAHLREADQTLSGNVCYKSCRRWPPWPPRKICRPRRTSPRATPTRNTPWTWRVRRSSGF